MQSSRTSSARPNRSLTSLQAKLDQWSQQEQQAYDEAQQIRPPGPLQRRINELLAALQLRANGLAGLGDALAQTGSKPSSDVADDLAKQAQLLTASDVVWTELFHVPATQKLTRQGVTGVIIPTSKFVTNPELVSARSFGTVYDRLKSTSTGGTPTGKHGTRS